MNTLLGVQRALRIVIPQIREGADAELLEPLAQPVLQVLAFVDALVEQQCRGIAEEQVPPSRPVLEPPVLNGAHDLLKLGSPGIRGRQRPDDRAA